MFDADLPTGQYLSCNLTIQPGSGGQTRALLTRSRIMHEQAGVTPRTLTFQPVPDNPDRIAQLVADNVITESMPVLNLYDTVRDEDLRDPQANGQELKPITAESVRELRTNGEPYRTVYSDPLTGQPLAYDYQRPDESVFARVAEQLGRAPVDGGAHVKLVDQDGQVVRSFTSRGAWYRNWMVRLCPGEDRVFVFMDSRFLVPIITPLKNKRFHLIYLMHNQHTFKERRWNSPSFENYKAVLRQIPNLDAMVNLTSRQSEDIAKKWGRTNHRFVVPNPIRPPVRPDPLPPRDPHRLAIVSRLEPQKGLADAIKAFALVREQVPDACLDLYGEGTQRKLIEGLIRELGLVDAVTMHGHDTLAQETLWTATGFLMSSVFEGYPLASLESLAHGCPVVAYDIKYGPREQIDDGVDGYLVAKGDVAAMAERAVRLLCDPVLARRMSEAAFAKADLHGHERFLRDWKTVLEGAIALKSGRTQILSGSLDVRRLALTRPVSPTLLNRVRQSTRLKRLVGSSQASDLLIQPAVTFAPLGGPDDLEVDFAATLHLEVGRNRKRIDEAVVTLTAICEADGSLADVPMSVVRSGTTFKVAARFGLNQVFDSLGSRGTAEDVHLRLRVDWRNSCWETFLGRPAVPRFEGVFGPDGELTLSRRQRT